MARPITARRIWVQVHLWLALLLGAFVALLGLTGAALTLVTPLARWEMGAAMLPPYVRAAEVPLDPARVDGWIAEALRRHPDLGRFHALAGAGTAPFRTAAPLLVAEPEDEAVERHTIIPLDPRNGEPLGRFVLEETVAGTLLALHVRLLLPLRGGLEATFAIAMALLLSALSGLWLWWPRPGQWRQALSWPAGARGRRAWLAAHNLVAVYGLAVLVLLAATGAYLVKPAWMDRVVSLASPIRPPQPAGRPAACDTMMAPGGIVAAALGHWPGAALGLAVFPYEPGKPAAAILRRANDANQRFGDSRMVIDARCGTVLAVSDARAMTAGERLKAWMLPLHADLGLGLPGKLLVALSGLSLPVLYATGLVLWWHRRRAERALRRKPAAGQASLG